MSTINQQDSPLARTLHTMLHEVSERLDIPADTVAEVVELWRDLIDDKLVHRTKPAVLAQLEQLKKLADSGEKEQAHERADKVLCYFIEQAGHPEIVEAFNAIRKWYA